MVYVLVACTGLANNAYFVGRREILSWINDFLGFNYTKIEECASAAAWCQIFHAMFPGLLPPLFFSVCTTLSTVCESNGVSVPLSLSLFAHTRACVFLYLLPYTWACLIHVLVAWTPFALSECVNLSRVNFLAKHEHEFVHNWKILQAAFVKANLNKVREGSLCALNLAASRLSWSGVPAPCAVAYFLAPFA